MRENTKSKFELEIPGWSGFVDDCKKQVDKDNEKWPSAYYPSAEICSKPKFCLITLEPGNSSSPIEDYATDVENGRRIFFPPVVTYCVWRYLCDENFNFYITDLVKSTKGCKLKDKEISMQRETWLFLPLLKKELELLGNPEITIKLSKGLNTLETSYKTYHYAHGAGAISREKEYERIKNESPEKLLYPNKKAAELTSDDKKKIKELKEELNELSGLKEKTKEWQKKRRETDDIVFSTLPSKEDIKKFAKKYMQDFGDKRYYTEAKMNEIINVDTRKGKELSRNDRKLLAFYRYEFTKIRKETEGK